MTTEEDDGSGLEGRGDEGFGVGRFFFGISGSGGRGGGGSGRKKVDVWVIAGSLRRVVMILMFC